MTEIHNKIKKGLEKAIKKEGINETSVVLDYPVDTTHGDLSTNLAMVYAKKLGVSPRDLALKLVEHLGDSLDPEVTNIEVAGSGFVNFRLTPESFTKEILEIDEKFGRLTLDKGKKIMVEYTDPNPFKIFHIGHLMANAIGESLSRLIEFSGAEVVRANYYGDVGLHVAKTMWGILKNKERFPTEQIALVKRIEYLGEMYVLGSNSYEDEQVKKEITEINKQIFEKSNSEINRFYDLGRSWSLEYFELIYQKLGTKFDIYFPESEVAEEGIEIVKESLKKGIFEQSEGAIVFPGEKYGVHTRVFINSQGLPTYEAKELGLTKKKFALYPTLQESVVVTANEQSDYFKVILKTVDAIYPEMAKKMRHLSHGILRPTTGKMSSRKGNIVSAESLLEVFLNLVLEKMKERDWPKEEQNSVAEMIAVAAIKYVILRQAIGGDIIYDPQKMVSFEGDSGPYLQYTCVRAKAVIAKAEDVKIAKKVKDIPQQIHLLEKLLVRFPGVVERSRLEYAPHHLVTYLVELSSAFNSYYANNKIIDEKDSLSPYRLALTKSFVHVMTNGLWLLGLKVPERM